MAKNNYSYPRVTLSQFAKSRSNTVAKQEDKTVLFMPFIAEKGPIQKAEYNTIHSLSELIEAYGDLEYSVNKQTTQVIYNWLNAGGTLFPYRLNHYELTDGKTLKDLESVYGTEVLGEDGKTSVTEIFRSKYVGKFYDELLVSVSVEKKNEKNNKATIFVKAINDANVKVTLETFKINETNYDNVLDASEYIVLGKDFKFAELADIELTVRKGLTGVNRESLVKVLEKFWGLTREGNTEKVNLEGSEAYTVLANPLAAPVDVVMDAGYPLSVKKTMINFIDNEEDSGAIRPDIVGIFDTIDLYKEIPEVVDIPVTVHGSQYRHTNVALWTQYFTVADEIFTGKDVYVTTTYFLSKLLPYNDNTYGIQFPTAGLRRGVLEDAKSISKNPTPAEKQEWFEKRINYTEKTSREYALMSQRTYDGSSEDGYTSLSFLNNIRVLEKMKKELSRLGREYLFEHNDSVTLSQMSNVLNRYMANWVANRTLSYADVTVAANANSTEAVDVRLVIRFNNTIEVIAIDITIE